jgi:hypothetical protein
VARASSRNREPVEGYDAGPERPALEKLRVRSLEKREPYIKQLAVLQEHIRVRVQAA